MDSQEAAQIGITSEFEWKFVQCLITKGLYNLNSKPLNSYVCSTFPRSQSLYEFDAVFSPINLKNFVILLYSTPTETHGRMNRIFTKSTHVSIPKSSSVIRSL